MADWIERHKILTVLLVAWLLGLVSWPTYRVFSESPPEIAASTATALATVYALPALAVALWKWRGKMIRGRPDDHG